MVALFLIIGLSFLLSLWGTLYLIVRMLAPAPLFNEARAVPVSILKPLSGVDPGLFDNLESFLFLDYPPGYELIFFVADPKDKVLDVLHDLHKKYPDEHFRIVLSDTSVGLNPKVANLDRAWTLAEYDTVLISDSNVRVHAGYLRELVPMLGTNGTVSAYVGCFAGEGVGGVLEEMMWNTFYARWTNLSKAIGVPFVIGKTILFRRSVAARFGTFSAFLNHVNEDFMMGQSMKGLGLDIEVMQVPVQQFVGRKGFAAYWGRCFRWHILQKSGVPVVFAMMPLGFPAVLAALSSIYSWQAPLVVLGAWYLIDVLQLSVLGSSLNPLAWLGAQLLAPFVWMHALFSNRVGWRGNTMKVGKGGWLIP